MLNATIRFPIRRFRQYLALREEHPEWQGDGHDLASVRERLAGMEKRGSASTRWYVPDFLLPSLIRTAQRLMKDRPDNDFLPWAIQELSRAAEIMFKYDPNTDTIDDHMQIRFFACDFPKMIDILTKAEAEAEEKDPVTRRHLARLLWCVGSSRGKTHPGVQAFDRISVRIYTTDIFPFRAVLWAMWEHIQLLLDRHSTARRRFLSGWRTTRRRGSWSGKWRSISSGRWRRGAVCVRSLTWCADGRTGSSCSLLA